MQNSAQSEALPGRAGAARMPDGTMIAYRHVPGPPQAPRVVLVHALAMSGQQWDEVVAGLAGSCALLIVDCRGHGASGKPPGPYDCDLFADDIGHVMDGIAWPDAVIVGCSMGGCVALAFGIRHGARTSGLVLIDTTAAYGPEAVPKWRERAGRARQDGMAALLTFQLDRWFTDGFRASDTSAVARCVAIFLANDTACYAATCDMLAAVELRPALAGIACPSLVIVGEEDYATPLAMARTIADGIASAELIVLPGARHFSPVEQPEAICAAVRQLAGRCAATVPAR